MATFQILCSHMWLVASVWTVSIFISQEVLLSSPGWEQWFLYLSVHQNNLEGMLNTDCWLHPQNFFFRRSRVRSENEHFWQVPRRCWCFRSGPPLRTTSLERHYSVQVWGGGKLLKNIYGVCTESVHPFNMKIRDICWRRYKIQETLYIGQWCFSPLQSWHCGTSHSSPNCHQLPCLIFLNLIDSLKSIPFQRWF